MALLGGVAYASWTIVILMILALICGGFIMKNLIDSEYEQSCAANPQSVENLKTVYNITLGILIGGGIIGLLALGIAIFASVKSLSAKADIAKQLFAP